jgi:Arc/MetJ family transcription regulator
MKRTNLVPDPELLDRATRLLGVKAYSAAVNLALAEVLRVRKIQSLPLFFGKGLWQGDLREMRDDSTRTGTLRRSRHIRAFAPGASDKERRRRSA